MTYREIDLDALADSDAFEGWGYVTLKVTKGDEILGVRIRVKSVPQEQIDTIRKQAPRPPVKVVMLDPSNPDHAALGVTARQKGQIPDFGDPEYLAQKEAFDLKFRNAVVGLGVAVQLQLKDGTPATTSEDKYRALEERGLSGFHFGEIAQRVLELTQWNEEERERFLTKPSVPVAVK
jgi:hypothetical protein